MRQYNDLSVAFFLRGATTPLIFSDRSTALITDVEFETIYPGGLYATASFSVPSKSFIVTSTYKQFRVVIRNGLVPVYEGCVTEVIPSVGESSFGAVVQCVGAWGEILGRQGVNKAWADNRTDSKTWVPRFITDDEDKFRYQIIEGKMHVNPNYGMDFVNGDYWSAVYKAPIGQTIKRIVYTYDFKESSGTWEQSLYRSTNGSSWTQMTNASGETYASGTTTVITTDGASATIDVTLATASRWLDFRLESKASNSPASGDHIHAMMFDVTVYTETGTISGKEIANDVIAACTDVNASEYYNGGPTGDLDTFVTSGWETFASILTRALSYGGGTGQDYAAYLRESNLVRRGTDGKPVLVVEAYPSVTTGDHEYEISLNDANLVAPVTLSQDNGTVVNWVVVEYTDLSGITQYVTPDDDATLTDATSVTNYGKRIPPGGSIPAGNTTQAQAVDIGVRYLAKYKSPQWRISQPITVKNYIRQSGEIRIPCSQIKAGKRVLFSNFQASPAGDPLFGKCLVSVITQTQYSDADKSTSLYFGDVAVI